MVYARGTLRSNYTLARQLNVSYSVWRSLSVLSGVNGSWSSRSQMQHLSRCQGGILTQSVSSRLSPSLSCSSPIFYTQRRCITLETYEKYFSPDSPPIAVIMHYLNTVHDMTGLPWYLTIGICTIVLRLVIGLPLRIVSKKNAGKNKVMNAYVKAFTESMSYQVQQEAARQNWDEKTAKGILTKRVRQSILKARQHTGAHPIKTAIYPMLQIPVWISMSFSLRNMAGYRVFNVEAVLNNPEMIKEGALWFSNLLVPDPTIIIPVTIGALHLLNNEINTYHMPKGAGTAIVKWLGRGFSLIFVPFACIVPSAISVYWTYSAFTAVIVSLVLNLKRSKDFLKLEPPLDQAYYYRYYKAMIEKETGIVVPEDFEADKVEKDDKENIEDSNVETGASVDSKVGGHKTLAEDVKPSEHVQPSELTRPVEHNRFGDTKQSGGESGEKSR